MYTDGFSPRGAWSVSDEIATSHLGPNTLTQTVVRPPSVALTPVPPPRHPAPGWTAENLKTFLNLNAWRPASGPWRSVALQLERVGRRAPHRVGRGVLRGRAEAEELRHLLEGRVAVAVAVEPGEG